MIIKKSKKNTMTHKKREVRFPIKTRIPKDTNILRVHGTMQEANYLANLVASNRDLRVRKASMQDILSLRLSTPPNKPTFDSVWWDQGYATTVTTEYFGLDRHGNAVLAWLPDSGPLDMKTTNTIYKESQHAIADLPVISRKVFLDVLDGKYGDPLVIPFAELLAEENSPQNNHNHMTIEEALESRLLFARLACTGVESQEHSAAEIRRTIAQHYLQAHWQISQERVTKGYTEEKGFIETGLESYHQLCTYHPSTSSISWTHENAREAMMDNYATASFVDISGLSASGNYNTTTSKVDLCTNKHKFVTWCLMMGDKGGVVHPRKGLLTYSYRDYLQSRKLPLLFTENTLTNASVSGGQIHQYNGWWFTEHGDIPTYNRNDQKAPKHLVTSMHIVGEKKITKSCKKSENALHVTLSEVMQLMKEPWDFYEITSSNEYHETKNIVTWKITYYKGTCDTARMIPLEKDIVSDMGLLGRIL
jgi:hypothetical protein